MINENYLGEEVREQMKQSFLDSGEIIVLNDFFDSETYAKIREVLKNEEGEEKIIPDQFSYKEIASDVVKELIDYGELKDLLSGILGEVNFDISVKRFAHRDYTLMHDEHDEDNTKLSGNSGDAGGNTKLSSSRETKVSPRTPSFSISGGNNSELSESMRDSSYKFFTFICDGWAEQWGGYKVYLDENAEEPLLFVPEENKFCLINSENRNSFVKYINHLAGKNSFVIIEGRLNRQP